MGAYVTINPTPSGDITGSGTPNYLAMFTSANVIGDSVIYQSGSKVYVSAANTFAVNTSTPSFSVGYDSQTITIAGVSYSAIESSYISVGTSINSQAMAASATASVASVYLGARSRGTFASPTAVQSGDSIHSFYSVGHDGTDYAIATAVEHIVGGTVAANQVPGRIKFSTANSSGTLTEAMSIYSTQQVSIGNYASPTNLRLVTIGQDTSYISLGSRADSTGVAAIYMNIASPSGVANNATLSATANTTVLNAGTNVIISNGGVTSATFGLNTVVFAPSALAGKTTSFTFTCPAHTNQTASTESENFKVTGNTKTWLVGALTTQRWNYFTANTAAFASASTITNSYGLYVEAATAGTNATITNNYAAGFSGNIRVITGSVANQGIVIRDYTGASTYGAIYMGVNPSNTNYTLACDGSVTQLNAPSNSVYLSVANNALFGIRGNITSGSTSCYTVLMPTSTGLTASTEMVSFAVGASSVQYSTGAITTQRSYNFASITYSFVGASTITNAYTAYISAPIAGTNATITNNYAAGFGGPIRVIGALGSNASVMVDNSTGGYGALWSDGTQGLIFRITSGDVVQFGDINAKNKGIGFVTNGSTRVSIGNGGGMTFADANNITFNTGTGTKIGTANTEKFAFWNATPIIQPTTAVTAATFVANTSGIVNDTATFDGYTIGQVVKALRNEGLLA